MRPDPTTTTNFKLNMNILKSLEPMAKYCSGSTKGR